VARVVLVTGASAGIGKACADRLHSRGWQVVGASRRATGSAGWQALAVDVDRDEDVAEGVAEVLRHHGRLDAVVAAAGWGLAGPVETTPLADAKAQFETNFWGAVRVVQAALPPMRAQGGGRIVLMSSVGGTLGIPFQAFYSASKFALEGFGESLAYEIEPLGIRVTLVEPGNVRTEFTARRRTVGLSASVAGEAGPPYGPAAAKALAVMERDERDGVAPDVVASVVERVLTRRRPPRRVTVGRLDERAGAIAKRLLPFALFERAARSSLGV
jgi:NAD(P)-dependent dehydrogenase (short-subunit alcohol dehydrogenase family)